MMNEKDELKNSSKAFGYIGEHAGVSRFSAVLNKMFKSNSSDAMIFPMNIREDDLYLQLDVTMLVLVCFMIVIQINLS